MSNQPVLQLRKLVVGYDGVPVVHDIDLVVRQGELVALLGANGAGKTTLLSSVAGLVRPLDGDTLFHGKEISGGLHSRARRGIGLVTEERAVIRRLTARNNLRLGQGKSERALEIFPELEHVLDRRAGLLSGGEQQMLVLGRILASEASLLLVDELSFGLAPLIVERLLGALREAAERGCAVLVVEQHPALILSAVDRGYVIGGGRMQLQGTGADLLTRLDEISDVYLSGAAGISERQ